MSPLAKPAPKSGVQVVGEALVVSVMGAVVDRSDTTPVLEPTSALNWLVNFLAVRGNVRCADEKLMAPVMGGTADR